MAGNVTAQLLSSIWLFSCISAMQSLSSITRSHHDLTDLHQGARLRSNAPQDPQSIRTARWLGPRNARSIELLDQSNYEFNGRSEVFRPSSAQLADGLKQAPLTKSGRGEVVVETFGQLLHQPSLRSSLGVLVEDEAQPATGYTASGLPTTIPIRSASQLSEASWPVNFCISMTLVAPDKGRVACEPSKTCEVIAIVGGVPSSCGNFYVFLTHTNAVGMGVLRTDAENCNANGSDGPIMTKTTLPSFSTNDLRFCYDSASARSYIYINNKIDKNESTSFVFPREGNVSFFVGSHLSDVNVLRGATLKSFQITALTSTTTTTMCPNLFWLRGGARENLQRRAMEIIGAQWPVDFCVSISITMPPLAGAGNAVRAIAALGGLEKCDSFVIFIGTNNSVGLGNNLDCSNGASAATMTAWGVPAGRHWLSFCYAQTDSEANIFVDGQEWAKKTDIAYYYDQMGFVTVLGGSHSDDHFAVLENATLWSMEVVPFTPGKKPENHSQICSPPLANREYFPSIDANGTIDFNPTTTTVTTTTTSTTTTTETTTTTTTTTATVDVIEIHSGSSQSSDAHHAANASGEDNATSAVNKTESDVDTVVTSPR